VCNCTAHLPQLAPLIHDTAERVRVAFIDLLCEIKTIRAIRFYDIVPIEHLLTRLELGALSLTNHTGVDMAPSSHSII
jgi:hypothetical protein